MIVTYRVWLKDRETNKRSQFTRCVFYVQDILESAHELLMKESDGEYLCYRIDLIDISDFTL